MLAIALVAGFLIGRDVAAHTRRTTAPGAPSVATRLQPASTTAEDGAAPTRVETPSAGTTVTDAGSDRYKFLLMQPDGHTPIRWNPCAPVHFKVRLGDVPATEIPHVQAAFDTIGAAMGGVTFVDDGTTDVVPDTVDGSAAAGTDLVFAFAGHGAGATNSDLLTGWEAGRGGFAATSGHPTHGSVVLDLDVWKAISRHDRDILYLHEIGHAVGLDHPRDQRQIMSSGAYDLPVEYQPGDLVGLARLGRQAGCTS